MPVRFWRVYVHAVIEKGGTLGVEMKIAISAHLCYNHQFRYLAKALEGVPTCGAPHGVRFIVSNTLANTYGWNEFYTYTLGG